MHNKSLGVLIFPTILILSLFAITVFAKPAPVRLSYEVSPIISDDSPRLKISLSFDGDRSGKTRVELPSKFAGQQQLYNGIQDLRVLTPGAKIHDTDKSEIKEVVHAPGEKIVLEYLLVQDWPGDPRPGSASFSAGSGYRPVIKKEYFHLLGNGVWILPEFQSVPSDEIKLQVSINWNNFPPEWKLANSFGTGQAEQIFQTSPEGFSSSVFVGGDFRIQQRQINGNNIFTAVRGNFSFTDEEFAGRVQKIVETERDFWHDRKHPFYLVTVLPLEKQPGSFSAGGTGLTDSFATFISENMTLDSISFLIAHEYFHNWNTLSFGGMKEPEALLYWFSEGFTDYYTYRLLRNAGLMDEKKYLAKYNEFLNEYYLSPVRNESNQRVQADFFKNYDVSKLPYRRGFLLATKWDRIIRQNSKGKKSLDDVMRNILRDAKKGKTKQISKEYLISVLSKYATYDFATDVEKYVENGETIGSFHGVFGSCVEEYQDEFHRFELGFALDSLKAKIISGVLENSAAYDAGMRNGQKIVERKPVYLNSPDKTVEMTVEEKGRNKSIIFFPRSKDKTDIPQLRFLQNLSEAEIKSCLNTN
jgi:predicted metalloprotease with PDZ domain